MMAAKRSVILVTLLMVGLWSALAIAKSNPDRMREKAEEFTTHWVETDYKHRMQGKTANYDRVSKDFAYLFSPSKITDIAAEMEYAANDDERRALTMLSNFIEEQIVMGKIARNVDDVANFELEEEAELLTGVVPLRQVRAMVLGETDRKQRKLAYVTLADKSTITNVYRNQIIATTIDAVTELGYDSYTTMRAKHQEIDYGALRSFCEQLLAETTASYEQALATQVRAVLDIASSKVRRYDLEFLTMSTEMDAALKNVKPVDVQRQVRRNLRLPSGKKILKIDLKDDQRREARGDLFPIDLLKKIVVAGREAGATADLAFRLQSLGRVERLLCLETPQWEFRRRADAPLDLAAGYLFESLLTEPAFATGVLGLNDVQAAALKRSRKFAELLQLRFDAATFLFELILYEDFKMGQTKFNTHMADALKVKFLVIDSELYLEDYTFAAAERLVGRQLAAQFGEVLRHRFGDSWWTSAEAGAFLRELWADGSRQTHTGLAANHGFTLFDTSPLVQQTSVSMR